MRVQTVTLTFVSFSTVLDLLIDILSSLYDRTRPVTVCSRGIPNKTQLLSYLRWGTRDSEGSNLHSMSGTNASRCRLYHMYCRRYTGARGDCTQADDADPGRCPTRIKRNGRMSQKHKECISITIAGFVDVLYNLLYVSLAFNRFVLLIADIITSLNILCHIQTYETSMLSMLIQVDSSRKVFWLLYPPTRRV